MLNDLEAMRLISRYRGEAIIVATMTANFAWPQVSTNPDFDLMLSGAMGKASSIGLGLALARPDKQVIILDGDGSLLMNLGALVTIADLAPPNLVHFIFKNSVYRTSGGQPIPGAGKVSFTALAKAAGYPNAYDFADLQTLEKDLPSIIARPGPTLVCLKTEPAMQRPPYPFTTTLSILPRFRKAMAKSEPQA